MTRSFSAPRTIRRIAARRAFKAPRGRRVVLTLGVPRRVPGSDWGCAVQITGLNAFLSRPRFVFGIDALQALHLAMKYASVELEPSNTELEWLGQKGDLGLPKFLPELPRPEQDRIEALVEREVARFRAAARRRWQTKAARKRSTRPAHSSPGAARRAATLSSRS